jgi:hypothetical protein
VALFYEYVSNLPNFDENNLGMGKLTVDRIDGNLGYVEGNLRWTNATIQNINKELTERSKTGLRGISMRQNGSFQVQIKYNNELAYIGTYHELSDAINNRNNRLTEMDILDEYIKHDTYEPITI